MKCVVLACDSNLLGNLVTQMESETNAALQLLPDRTVDLLMIPGAFNYYGNMTGGIYIGVCWTDDK